MVNVKLYRPFFIALVGLFVFFSAWWAFLHATGNADSGMSRFFGATYGLVALVGGIYGLSVARGWGFFKSYFGKAIIFLSLGLVLQEFGQLAFSYYNIVREVAIPYPSIADFGFFGAIPLYIAGAYNLMQGLGVGTILKKDPLKLLVGIAVALAILGACYWFFLKGYDSTEKNILTIFLDFGYPLGQVIYVSLALVILLSLGRMLGGVMKKPVLLLLAAFLLQYAADFNFLYQTIQGTWTVSGYGDYLYLVAYFAMGLSLIYLNNTIAKTVAKLSKGKTGGYG
jgi:hypothetical protein